MLVSACGGGGGGGDGATGGGVVVDTLPPVLQAPASVTLPALDANGLPLNSPTVTAFLATITATDNIDGALPLITHDAPAVLPLGTTTVHFSVSDTAGNQVAVAVDVVVADLTAPVVTAPTPITVAAVDANGIAASDPALAPLLAGASAVDNVDGAITVIGNDAPTTFPLGSTTVTFSAVDGASNSGSATVLVTVADLTPPVVTGPGGIALAAATPGGTPASDPALASFLANVSALDNVDGVITAIGSDAPTLFAVGTTTVTFSAVDAAGNPGSATATVAISNGPTVTVPPTLIVAAVDGSGTPASLPAVVAWLNAASASDSQGGALSVGNDAPTQLPLGNTVVTFSATAGGLTTSVGATLTVVDQTPPVVTAPAPVTINAADWNGLPASDPAIAPFLGGASAVDNVDGAITVIGNNAPSTFPIGVTTVTFSVHDAAGNLGSASADVTVPNGPSVTAPTPVTVDAASASGTPASATAIATFLNGASALDGAGSAITVTHNAPTTLPLGATVVTFSANANNLTATATATVTVTDLSPPTVTAPAPISVTSTNGGELPATTPAIAAFLTGASASDAVDGTISLISHNAPSTFPLGTTLVTFGASDAAGHQGSASASVTVSNGPLVTAPTPITVAARNGSGVAASDPAITAFLNGATAFDTTGAPLTVSHDAPTVFPVGSTTVTFSATAATVTTTATATVVVADQTAPTLTPPAPIAVPVGGATSLPASTAAIAAFLTGATALDNVDGPITPIVHNAPTSFPMGLTVVDFSAQDAAGNVATGSAGVVVINGATLIPPLATAVDADSPQGASELHNTALKAFLNGALAFDATGKRLPVSYRGLPGINDPKFGTFSITFYVSSPALSAVANLTIADLTPPTVQAPGNIVVQAAGLSGTPASDPAIAAFLGGASANDAATAMNQIVIGNDAPTTFPKGVTTVTFTAVDGGGNQTSAQATVTVADLPVVTPPAPVQIDVTRMDPLPLSHPSIATFLAGASAVDSLGGTLSVQHDLPPFARIHLGVTTVHFTAVDGAGTPQTAASTITLVDTTPPVIAAPASVVVMPVAPSTTALPSDPGLAQFLASPTARDGVSGDLSVRYNQPLPALTVGSHPLVFSATDPSGNTSSANATITVSNTLELIPPAPVVVTTSSAAGLASSDPAIVAFLGGASARDSLGGLPTITHNGPTQFPVGTTPVTFTAHDGGGAPYSVVSSVTVADLTPPVVTPPAPLTLSRWTVAPDRVTPFTVIDLAATTDRTLALMSDGRVWQWGLDTPSGMTPAPVPGLHSVVAIAAAANMGMALKSDGTVWTWGGNSKGLLGRGDGNTATRVETPAPIPTLNGVRSIQAHADFAWAIQGDGTVWGWGYNNAAQLCGASTMLNVFAPVRVEPLRGMARFATGSTFHLGLKNDGSLWVWGVNSGGMMGHAASTGTTQTTPVPLDTPIAGAAEVFAGFSHLMVRTDQGKVFVWGYNSHASLGQGSISNQATPIALDASNGLNGSVAALADSYGGFNEYALARNGTVWRWGGYNMPGGFAEAALRPVPLPGVDGAVKIVANQNNGFVLRRDGTVWGWGILGDGGMGAQPRPNLFSPTPVGPLAFGGGSVSGYGLSQSDIALFLAGGSAADAYDGPLSAIAVDAPNPLPVGSSAVTFEVRDAAGNLGRAQATIAVLDRPTLTAPSLGDAIALSPLGGAVAATDATALAWLGSVQGYDAAGQPLTVTHNAPTLLPVGSTAVTFSATDPLGSVQQATYTVTVRDTTPPVLVGTPPAFVDLNGGPNSGLFLSDPQVTALLAAITATDAVDPAPVVTHNLPALLGRGQHTVVFTATDAAGNVATMTGYFYVIGPPEFPPNVTLIAATDATGVAANAPAAAGLNAYLMGRKGSDGHISSVAVTSYAPLPTQFPLGDTTVQIMGSDRFGNVGTGSVTVRVVDMTPPVVTPPLDITVMGDGIDGVSAGDPAVAAFLAAGSAVDNVAPNPAVTATTTPRLPYGTNTITFSASDGVNVGSATAKITVAQAPRTAPLSGRERLVAGQTHTLALTDTGVALGWGDNTGLQLGTQVLPPLLPQAQDPAPLPNLGTMLDLATHTCHALGIDAAKQVWSWGCNAAGQLGNNSLIASATPVKIGGLSGASRVAAGATHSMVLLANGSIWSWGSNANGQLSDSSTLDSATPVLSKIQSVALPKAIAAGNHHSLALLSDASVWAWGSSQFGQVGEGVLSGALATPLATQVVGLTKVTAIAAGGDHALALVGNKAIWAWGKNDRGQLGDGTTINTATPVQVLGLPPGIAVLKIAAGQSHSAALLADGSVWSWGSNLNGVLGDATFTTSNSLAPIQAVGVATAVDIACGGDHTMVLMSDGSLRGWGNDASRQIRGVTAVSVQRSPTVVLNHFGGSPLYLARVAFDFEGGWPTSMGVGLNQSPWFITTDFAATGRHSLKSAPIADGNTSNVKFVADSVVAGSIAFDLRVDSEAGMDELVFSIDGVVPTGGRWSGAVGFQRVQFSVPAGSHTYSWSYIKNGAVAVGLDAAWIDNIVLP